MPLFRADSFEITDEELPEELTPVTWAAPDAAGVATPDPGDGATPEDGFADDYEPPLPEDPDWLADPLPDDEAAWDISTFDPGPSDAQSDAVPEAPRLQSRGPRRLPIRAIAASVLVIVAGLAAISTRAPEGEDVRAAPEHRAGPVATRARTADAPSKRSSRLSDAAEPRRERDRRGGRPARPNDQPSASDVPPESPAPVSSQPSPPPTPIEAAPVSAVPTPPPVPTDEFGFER